MRTLLGAVGGALAVLAVIGSYNLGAHYAMNSAMTMAPAMTTQMAIGPDGVVRPYLVRTGEATFGTGWQVTNTAPAGMQYVAMPLGTSAVATPVSFTAPAASSAYATPVRTSQIVEEAPAPRRVQRSVVTTRAPGRSWQKSALLIGGSAGTGAGIGALVGGKKGALAGAAIGGGAAALIDQMQRR